MLKKITMTCFRQHESLSLNFTEGLNCIRGANEAGKSTIMEAWAYGFFGSRALRDSLDDVVTWNHNPRELKVVIEYGDWTISRSKGGAEVTCMGQVHVTGQSEVTRFCEGLIGCDASTAANLMFSNQAGLRGILDSGPKATATLIEDLGEFDLFDRVLDAAQHRLSLGSAAIQEERLRTLIAQREALPAVTPPDEAAHAVVMAGLSQQLQVCGVTLATVLTPAITELNNRYQGELSVRMNRDRLMSDLQRVDRQLADNEAEVAKLPAGGEIESTTALEQQIAEAAEYQTLVAAYQKYQTLPVVEHFSRLAHAAQLRDAQTEVREAEAARTQAIRDRDVAAAKLVTSSVCGFCGQDVSQFPEAAAKNAALQLEIEKAEAACSRHALAAASAEQRVTSLQSIVSDEQRVLAAVRGIERWLERDDSVIPVRFDWRGDSPAGDGPDVVAMQAQLKAVKARNDATIAARAKLEVLAGQRVKLQEQRAAVAMQLEAIEVMPEDAFQALLRDLDDRRTQAEKQETERQRLVAEIKVADQQHEQAVAAWQQAEQRKQELDNRIAETKSEIEQLVFNNTLVRKIRSARPVVGNKLWTMVLSSVSTIFSQMRGVSSVVQKGDNGFLINGKAVTSYSGSTLDLLGLAVRSALVKTFIPSCPFIVLDEPSAACDQDRTNSMLGYIAASSFSQVLLVTHNDASESFADNLIQL